jgi:pimeloyl-ACP methyl ester carboxylesterase
VLSTTWLRDSVVATFLTNPLFTRKLLEAFIDNPARATDARVAIYQRPLSVSGSTVAIGDWLPELLGPPVAARSQSPAAYATLPMPVIAIWGKLDSITPIAQGERLVRLLPHAELAVIDDVGHIPQIEDATRFNGMLLKSVQQLTR